MAQLEGRMAMWMGLKWLDCQPGRKDYLPNLGAMLSLLCLVTFVTTASAQAQEPGWEMNVSRVVKATPQSDATLPCTVSYPDKNYNGNLTLTWKRGCSEIFKCIVLPNFSTCVNTEKNNVKLIGTPREGNLTLQIKNVSLQDSMLYVCRIQLKDPKSAFESRPGTILLVSDEEPDLEQVACPSQNITVGLGVLSGLLFIALLLVLAYVFWNKRGKKTRKAAGNTKPSSNPPSIPLETPSQVPIYENIPRGLKPLATKPPK